MRRTSVLIIMLMLGLCGVLVAGCTTTQKGAGIGALGGGAAGAIIGNQSGHAVEGGLIGAGVGAVGGALVGHEMGK